MSLTLKSRPLGVTLSTTAVQATVSASGTYALFTKATHGLSTGDYVFITADTTTTIYPSSYFGIFYVEKNDNNSFFIQDTRGVRIAYLSPAASVNYYKYTLKHYVNALHLPINYTLYSDSWPTNTVDTARTISSIANDNGYMQITASGDIKATGTASKLDWVKISGGSNDGIYQIINYTSDTVFTINMAYDASSTLAGNTIQYYYNNYYASIKVYGGLPSTHYVNTLANPLKSFALICTIKVTPGSDNYFAVNVSDYLKKDFEVLKNQTMADTWPLDIDSFDQFYISYADAWDVSNGTSVTSTVGSYTTESVYPYAVNASLPFGNRYSGYLSEYVYGGTSNLLKFLTPMQYPTIFPGQYWDISFWNQWGLSAKVKKEYYLNGVVQSTSYDTLADYGPGVYRNQLTIGASEDRIDLTAVINQAIASLASWTNSGTGTSWTLGASPTVNTSLSKYLTTPFAFVPGHTYNFTFSASVTGGSIPFLFVQTDQGESIYSMGKTTVTNQAIAFTPTLVANYIQIYLQETDFGTPTATVTKFDYTTEYVAISETKTVTVDTVCSKNFQDKYVDLCWKNYLGGHDYWRFKAFSDRGLDILETRESERNIYQTWPNSYNEFQDTITQETMRRSKQTIVVRAENLTQDQLNDLFMIKASPLVQICNSRTSKKTVIVDKDSFVYNNEKDNLQSLSFKLTMTNELPVQSL